MYAPNPVKIELFSVFVDPSRDPGVYNYTVGSKGKFAQKEFVSPSLCVLQIGFRGK